MPLEQGRKRLFFALWPDRKIAGELHRLANAAGKGCGGRVMRQDTLHLTLAFLGEVDGARIPQLAAVASDIAVPAFRFKLDRLDYWQHHHILWAGCGEQPVALLQLVHQLQDRLRAAGLRVDNIPFTPHVTLVRNFQCKAPPMPDEIEWAVAEFTLVESLRSAQGVGYHFLSRWPLWPAIG